MFAVVLFVTSLKLGVLVVAIGVLVMSLVALWLIIRKTSLVVGVASGFVLLTVGIYYLGQIARLPITLFVAGVVSAAAISPIALYHGVLKCFIFGNNSQPEIIDL